MEQYYLHGPCRSDNVDHTKPKNRSLTNKHRLRIKSHAGWVRNLLVMVLDNRHDDAAAGFVVVEANKNVYVTKICVEAFRNAVLIAVVVLA